MKPTYEPPENAELRHRANDSELREARELHILDPDALENASRGLIMRIM